MVWLTMLTWVGILIGLAWLSLSFFDSLTSLIHLQAFDNGGLRLTEVDIIKTTILIMTSNPTKEFQQSSLLSGTLQEQLHCIPYLRVGNFPASRVHLSSRPFFRRRSRNHASGHFHNRFSRKAVSCHPFFRQRSKS